MTTKIQYYNIIHKCYNNISFSPSKPKSFKRNVCEYLGLAANGESVILTSRLGNFKIVPVTEDDSVVSKSEFLAKIEAARASIVNGEGISVKGKNELSSFLESL